jgi:hypothetical protein
MRLKTWDNKFAVESKFSHAFTMQVRFFDCLAASLSAFVASILSSHYGVHFGVAGWRVCIYRLELVDSRTESRAEEQCGTQKRVLQKMKLLFVQRDSGPSNCSSVCATSEC